MIVRRLVVEYQDDGRIPKVEFEGEWNRRWVEHTSNMLMRGLALYKRELLKKAERAIAKELAKNIVDSRKENEDGTGPESAREKIRDARRLGVYGCWNHIGGVYLPDCKEKEKARFCNRINT